MAGGTVLVLETRFLRKQAEFIGSASWRSVSLIARRGLGGGYKGPRGGSPPGGPPFCRRAASLKRIGSRTESASQSRYVFGQFMKLTHRAPGSRGSAGSRSTRTECPRNCWQTIFICGEPQWYGKPLKQLGLVSRQADIRRVTGASRVNIAAVAIYHGSRHQSNQPSSSLARNPRNQSLSAPFVEGLRPIPSQ